MSQLNNDTLLLIFVGVTGLAVLMQAVVLLALFLSVRKTAAAMQNQIEELRSTITPVLTETKSFLDNVGPKIESVASDLAELAHGLRVQSADLQDSATEVLDRVRRQASRLDMMCSDVLDTVDRAGSLVTSVVNLPLRQLTALLAAARAAFGVLRSPVPAQAKTHSPADKDMFV
ncbi:MAG TPA: hypothetical protein VMV57_01645 [Terracidiphilus sp.]|nr:hypothetical protein [Terracidiphilus sp.]